MKTFGLVTKIIIFMLFSFTLTSYSEQKIKDQDNQLSREHASQFIQWLNSIGSFEKMSQKDISVHFAHQFKYYINGKLNATNARSLYQRFLSAKNHYKAAYIHFPIKVILVDGNKAAARYLVTFVHTNGIHKNTFNTVIIIFNEMGKVTEFYQSFDNGAPLPSYWQCHCGYNFKQPSN